jgi:LacI family transcriptional regulator
MPTVPTKRLIGVKLHAAFEHQRAALRGIRRYALEHPAWRLALVAYGGRLEEAGTFETGVAGFIGSFRAQGRHADDLALAQRLAPGRVVGLSSWERELAIPRVVTDNVAVGRMAAEFLLESGYRHFAYVGDNNQPEHAASAERGEAFRDCLAALGQDCRLCGFKELFEPDFALPVPCAVLAFNDTVARILIEQLLERGVPVPEQAAVLGVDDDPLERDICAVPLSSIRLDGERIGYAAARLLDALIDGAARRDPVVMRIAPLGVMERASTGAHVSDDPLLLRALHRIRTEIPHLRTVEDALALAGSSRRALERRFRKALGQGIYEVMQEARVEYAKRLLVETDLKLIDLAAAAGFGDSRMLSVLFRRHTGETPSAYRRRRRGRR